MRNIKSTNLQREVKKALTSFSDRTRKKRSASLTSRPKTKTVEGFCSVGEIRSSKVRFIAQCSFSLKVVNGIRYISVMELRRGFFFSQAEDGIRDHCVTGVQTCALPIYQLLASAAMRASFQAPRSPPRKLARIAALARSW